MSTQLTPHVSLRGERAASSEAAPVQVYKLSTRHLHVMDTAPQTDVGSGEEASWINDQATRIRRVAFDPVAVVEIATAIGPTSSPFVRLRRMHAEPGHNSRAYSAASRRDIRYFHDCVHNPTRHAGHSFLRRAEVCCRGQESRAGQARRSSALETF